MAQPSRSNLEAITAIEQAIKAAVTGSEKVELNNELANLMRRPQKDDNEEAEA